MLFERKFEDRTRGLVCGVPTLVTPTLGVPLVTPIQRAKRGQLFIADAKPLVTEWRPWLKHYKVVMRAREGGEIIWQRPFATQQEAVFCYASLTGLQFEPGRHYHLPPVWLDGDVEIVLAIVATFNATNTNSGADWASGGNLTPANTTTCEYLCIAGGGGGAGNLSGTGSSGGGGAGGYRTDTGLSVTPGASNTITVGSGGNGGAGGQNVGADGGNSVFSSITSTGGGGGGAGNASAGRTGGSGGGGGNAQAGGSGTSGQGNAGGAGSSNLASAYGGGGGGGSGGTGAAGTGGGGGNGGSGTSSSITGSSVNRGGGGGGGAQGGGGNGTGQAGGGNGGYNGVNPSAATANTGSGGGGAADTGASRGGGSGGSGVIIVSWTPTPSTGLIFGLPFMP